MHMATNPDVIFRRAFSALPSVTARRSPADGRASRLPWSKADVDVGRIHVDGEQ
jgi:hypothetical protein